MVAGFMASLNVAEITWLTGTPVAPAAGTVETTAGATVVTVSFPHPPTKISKKIAKDDVTLSLQVRI
jgi:hypothetical protein